MKKKDKVVFAGKSPWDKAVSNPLIAKMVRESMEKAKTTEEEAPNVRGILPEDFDNQGA